MSFITVCRCAALTFAQLLELLMQIEITIRLDLKILIVLLKFALS